MILNFCFAFSNEIGKFDMHFLFLLVIMYNSFLIVCYKSDKYD